MVINVNDLELYLFIYLSFSLNNETTSFWGLEEYREPENDMSKRKPRPCPVC